MGGVVVDCIVFFGRKYEWDFILRTNRTSFTTSSLLINRMLALDVRGVHCFFGVVRKGRNRFLVFCFVSAQMKVVVGWMLVAKAVKERRDSSFKGQGVEQDLKGR